MEDNLRTLTMTSSRCLALHVCNCVSPRHHIRCLTSFRRSNYGAGRKATHREAEHCAGGEGIAQLQPRPELSPPLLPLELAAYKNRVRPATPCATAV